MEHTNNTESSIVLRLTTKGKYHWAIKFSFNPARETPDEVVNTLKEFDQALKDKFPNNTSITPVSHFSKVDEFDEDLDT